MAKRQKITLGSILEIKIENYYNYAQILDKSTYAFFDHRTTEPLKDYNELLEASVLFVISVYKNAVAEGHWLKVGNLQLREDLKELPMQFIQDSLYLDRFEFYNPNTGEITYATKEKIKGLERASVWDANHVEDRIRDYYNGVSCKWLQNDF